MCCVVSSMKQVGMLARTIFFFAFICLTYGKALETFYLSLNEARSDQGQWAEAKPGMPALTEMTICHWEKIFYFNWGAENVWSYCVKTSDLFGGIDCFQYHVKVYTTEHVGGKTFGFDIVFQNSSRKEYIKTKNYEERKWNHVCWRADSNGENHFFINGEVRKTFYNPLVVIPSNQKKKSVFLVGQEPWTL